MGCGYVSNSSCWMLYAPSTQGLITVTSLLTIQEFNVLIRTMNKTNYNCKGCQRVLPIVPAVYVKNVVSFERERNCMRKKM